MNNPILLSLAVYQVMVAIYYFARKAPVLGLLFCVYAVADIVFLFIKLQ